MDAQKIIEEAKAAGDAAVKGAADGYPCGFAWIVIKPARGAFVQHLKDTGRGRKGYYGGWELSSYDACNFSGQNMYAKADGCWAFVNVLRQHGINATVETRID